MILSKLPRLIFPERCRCCKKPLKRRESALCPACRAEYENAKKRICPRCKRPYTDCGCRPDVAGSAVVGYLSLFKYKNGTPGASLIFSLKKKKDRAAASILSKDLAKCLTRRGLTNEDCVVTCLPRSRAAVAEKGTDQAKYLAKKTAQVCRLPFLVLLKRRKDAQLQKNLGKKDRIENVAGVFAFKGDPKAVAGKRIILVDDVCTTGASTAACADLLKENGARDVVVITAGRA